MIKRLSDEVINQISAGEFIKEPVNVIKELIENCIDSESKMIEIEIKEGGLELIRIRDEGKGVNK